MLSGKQTVSGAIEIIDVSRLSSEQVAPFLSTWITDSTFGSTIRMKQHSVFFMVELLPSFLGRKR